MNRLRSNFWTVPLLKGIWLKLTSSFFPLPEWMHKNLMFSGIKKKCLLLKINVDLNDKSNGFCLVTLSFIQALFNFVVLRVELMLRKYSTSGWWPQLTFYIDMAEHSMNKTVRILPSQNSELEITECKYYQFLFTCLCVCV